MNNIKDVSEAQLHEQAFIGGVVLLGESHGSISLSPADFEIKELGQIWEYCQKHAKINITDMQYKFDAEWLGKMITSVPTSINLAKYARKISELSYRRHLAFSLDKASQMAASGNIDDVANFVISALDNAPAEKEAVKMSELIADAYADLSEAQTNGKVINFVETGMVSFDNAIGGLQENGLIVVAGRPSMGKTAYASCLAANVGAKGNVLMFSMEMSGKQLALRFLASQSNVDLQSMMQGSLNAGEWNQLAQGFAGIKDRGIWVNDRTSRTVSDIKAECRRFKRRNKAIDLVIIDYLTLLNMPKSLNKVDAVGDVSRELKLLAGEIECPVVLLSQLNRSLEQRSDKRPMMSDLRDSGAIEQDADQIIFPFRPEVYDKSPNVEGLAEIIVAKNRNGRTGMIRMSWLAKSATFKEATHEDTF